MKTKKNVMIVLVFLLTFNAFSLTRDFVSQMDSEIDPKVMCFPSAMINSAIYLGIDLPVKESKYTNIVDIYDDYLHSKEIKFWIRNYAPAYIRTMLYSDKYDNDAREIWQIEECAFNAFMGQKTCKLRINKNFDYLEETVKNGGVAVISGIFSGRKHCVSLIKIEDDIVTFIDSFGSPYDNYKHNSSYQIIEMSTKEFKRRVRQEDTGKYTFIEFRKDFPQSLITIRQNTTNELFYYSDTSYGIFDGISEPSELIKYRYYCESANNLGLPYILTYESFVDSANFISDIFGVSFLEAVGGPILKNSFVNVSLEYLVVLYGLSREKGLDISDTHKIETSFYSAEGNIENALRIFVDGYERYLFLQDSEESNEAVKYYRNLYLENVKDENVFYMNTGNIFSTPFYEGLFKRFMSNRIKLSINSEYTDILFNRVICVPLKKRLEEERVSEIGKKYYVDECGSFVINF